MNEYDVMQNTKTVLKHGVFFKNSVLWQNLCQTLRLIKTMLKGLWESNKVFAGL